MAFNLPIQNYFTKMVEPTDWVRPIDWPTIIDAPNEVQFLFSDISTASCTVRTQFSRTSGSQNIVIDWGDGSTDTITAIAQTDTTHQYVVGSGTPCSRGYTTFKIRVYFTGVGVSILSQCRLFTVIISGNTASPSTTSGLLEVYYGDGTQTTSMTSYYASLNTTNGQCNFSYLEYVKLPSTITFTTMATTFESCSNLAVVVMPTSASLLTSITGIFSGCLKLRSLTFPSNAVLINGLQSAFLNCVSLTSVTFPTTLNNCSTFLQAFSGCASLKNITLPSINSCVNLTNIFSNCLSLEWVKFTSLPTFGTSTAVSFDTSLNGCNNLQNVYFPSTCSSNAVYNCTSMFLSSFNLKSIIFPSGFNPSTLNGAFTNCYNLKSVTFQSSAPNLTVLTSCFSSCFNLTNVTLPSSVGATITLEGLFQNCYSLKNVTIPNTYTVTSLQSTFTSCRSLKTINWTPGAQNSLTSMISTVQNCVLLETFPMPTSMTALQSIQLAFNGCRSMRSISFPSTLNSLTSINSAFGSCILLTDLTLPTSAILLSDFTGAFSNCLTIRTITLPATISTGTLGFPTTFQACSSLRTITFPSAAQLVNVNNLVSTFAQCGNLNTLNNFNLVGSLTATPLVAANANTFMSIPLITFSCPLSILNLNNTSTGFNNNVQQVRLLNTSAGQWTGASPQINVSYTNISTANLVQLFNDMAAQGTVTAKTINITSATGAAGLTPANRAIITSLGWTITG